MGDLFQQDRRYSSTPQRVFENGGLESAEAMRSTPIEEVSSLAPDQHIATAVVTATPSSRDLLQQLWTRLSFGSFDDQMQHLFSLCSRMLLYSTDGRCIWRHTSQATRQSFIAEAQSLLARLRNTAEVDILTHFLHHMPSEPSISNSKKNVEFLSLEDRKAFIELRSELFSGFVHQYLPNSRAAYQERIDQFLSSVTHDDCQTEILGLVSILWPDYEPTLHTERLRTFFSYHRTHLALIGNTTSDTPTTHVSHARSSPIDTPRLGLHSGELFGEHAGEVEPGLPPASQQTPGALMSTSLSSLQPSGTANIRTSGPAAAENAAKTPETTQTARGGADVQSSPMLTTSQDSGPEPEHEVTAAPLDRKRKYTPNPNPFNWGNLKFRLSLAILEDEFDIEASSNEGKADAERVFSDVWAEDLEKLGKTGGVGTKKWIGAISWQHKERAMEKGRKRRADVEAQMSVTTESELYEEVKGKVEDAMKKLGIPSRKSESKGSHEVVGHAG